MGIEALILYAALACITVDKPEWYITDPTATQPTVNVCKILNQWGQQYPSLNPNRKP